MKNLFGSMGDPSLPIGRGMRRLLRGLMVMESGCEGLLKQAQEALRLTGFSFQPRGSDLLGVLNDRRVQRDKRGILQGYAQAWLDLLGSPARLERAVGGLL